LRPALVINNHAMMQLCEWLSFTAIEEANDPVLIAELKRTADIIAGGGGVTIAPIPVVKDPMASSVK